MQPQVSGKVGSLVGWFLGGPCSAFPKIVEYFRGVSCWGWGEQKWRGEGSEVSTTCMTVVN